MPALTSEVIICVFIIPETPPVPAPDAAIAVVKKSSFSSAVASMLFALIFVFSAIAVVSLSITTVLIVAPIPTELLMPALPMPV